MPLMKIQTLLLILVVSAWVGCSPADQGNARQAVIAPDPAVIAKLQEIVDLRQKIWKDAQLLAQAGNVTPEKMVAAEVALAEARLELAREQGKTDAVQTELKNILGLREGWLKRVEAQVEGGRMPADEVLKARIALAEAQLRLARNRP